jgi:O-antigen ligase
MRTLLVLLIATLAGSDILQTGMSLGPGLSAKNALLYPIALGLIFRMALTGRFRMRLPLVNFAFIIWCTYGLLTWIACVTVIHYPGYQAREAALELKSVLFDSAIFFFAFFYGTETEGDFLLMARTLALGIGLANILTLADLAGVVHLGLTVGQAGVEADRVFGLFGHANDTGALLVCLLPMLVAVALASRGTARIFWYAGAFASLAVLILTISRGAYVGLAVGYTWGLWLCRRWLPAPRVMKWILLGATGIVLSVGLAAVLLPDIVQAMFERLFNQSMAMSMSVASSGRTTHWMNVIDAMAARPLTLLTGYGWYVYGTMFELGTHNFYLEQWFGLGVIGVLCFVTILWQTVTHAQRAVAAATREMRPFMIAFVFGMLGLAISLIFGDLDKPWAYVWVYLGFALRAAAGILESAQARAAQAKRSAPPRPAYTLDVPASSGLRQFVGEPRR